MQILKKKYILTTTTNYIDTYQYYLKNLNFFNKFKNKNKTLLKDILLCKIDDLFLININLKENYYFPIISINKKNLYKENNNNLIYFIKNQREKMIDDMVISTEIMNSFFLKFYISIFLKKFNKRKFFITKFLVTDFKNKKEKIYYKKKIKINLSFIRSRILKRYKKKYNLITFNGFIFKTRSKNLFFNTSKKKKIYNSYLKRKYNIRARFKIKIKKSKQKFQYFYLLNTSKKKKMKLNFSRKILIKDFSKNEIKDFNNLRNTNNLKKVSFLFK